MKDLMSKKGYTVRAFAQLTGNSTAQIQRLRLGNTAPRDCNFDSIFALLPELKVFLDQQTEDRNDKLAEELAAREITNKDDAAPFGSGKAVSAPYGASMCPVIKEWQGIGPDVASAIKVGLAFTPGPYGYSGEPSINGLYAFQLEHNSGEPKIPYGATVYVEWNAPLEIGQLYLFVNNEQPEFGYLYRQTASDTFVLTRLSGEDVTTDKKDLRGRVFAWTVRA